MADPLIKIHYHENIATILLNRADKRNALSRALLNELGQAIQDVGLGKEGACGDSLGCWPFILRRDGSKRDGRDR